MPGSETNSQKPRLDYRDTAHPVPHGFLVADASLKLIFANSDAVAILTYPGLISQSLDEVFQKKIRPALLNVGGVTPNGNGHSIMKLKSGRRTYICRAFLLNSNGKGMNGTATLLMLERGMPERLALGQVALQFRLTQREQQAVALLLQGLSNKEIAETMGVSSNTVKAFLRMVTVRMGVSSRSGIVTKILEVLLSGGNISASEERSHEP